MLFVCLLFANIYRYIRVSLSRCPFVLLCRRAVSLYFLAYTHASLRLFLLSLLSSALRFKTPVVPPLFSTQAYNNATPPCDEAREQEAVAFVPQHCNPNIVISCSQWVVVVFPRFGFSTLTSCVLFHFCSMLDISLLILVVSVLDPTSRLWPSIVKRIVFPSS